MKTEDPKVPKVPAPLDAVVKHEQTVEVKGCKYNYHLENKKRCFTNAQMVKSLPKIVIHAAKHITTQLIMSPMSLLVCNPLLANVRDVQNFTMCNPTLQPYVRTV